MDRMSGSSKKTHVDTLIPNVMLFRGGACGRYLELDEFTGVKPP